MQDRPTVIQAVCKDIQMLMDISSGSGLIVVRDLTAMDELFRRREDIITFDGVAIKRESYGSMREFDGEKSCLTRAYEKCLERIILLRKTLESDIPRRAKERVLELYVKAIREAAENMDIINSIEERNKLKKNRKKR